MSEMLESKIISSEKMKRLGGLIDQLVVLYGDASGKSEQAKKCNFVSSFGARKRTRFNNQAARPMLKFDVVKEKLSCAIIEGIFREFAPKIKNDDEIIVRGRQISKGSLNMNLANGLWKRWSTGEVGDIINFVEVAENVSNIDALEILADRAGIKREFSAFNKNGSNFSGRDQSKSSSLESLSISNDNEELLGQSNFKKPKKKSNWVPFELAPSNVPEFNPDKDLSFWLKVNKYEVTNKYEYRDIYGRLIGYTIRVIESKIDPDTSEIREVKHVMPVSYCKNEDTDEKRWTLKGLLVNDFKPIYRAEKIQINPTKPILIVEGEKTVDSAAKLLPEYCVISWLGGSQVIDKVDWRVLRARQVIIWPDCDEPGKKAAQRIEENLQVVSGDIDFRLVKIVDVEALNLPEKWDLADEMPNHLTLEKVRSLLASMLKL